MLGGVVDDVARPEDPHLMVDAVEPVVGEVVGEEEQHVGPPLVGRHPQRRQLVEPGVDDEHDQLPDRVDDDVAAAHGQARARVARLVADQVVVAEVLEREQLHDEQQHKGGDRVVKDLGHRSNLTPARPGPALGCSAMRARLAICLGLAALLAGCGESSAQPFRAQVHVTPVASTRIAWYERGQGPPLVMLIGTGSTMAEWDPALLRLLSREHRLILFDYPGVGLSGPWHGRDFDSLANVTAGLMRAIDLHRADVLGWSMGGFVAQRLAIDHPGRVSRLILAGTNPGGRHTVLGTPAAQAIDSDPNRSDAEILRELYPPGRQAEGRLFLRRLESASQSGEIPDDFDVPAATTRAQVAAENPWLGSNRNYRQLATITAPALVTTGARDPVTPPLNLRRIAAQIPNAKFVAFPGAHAFLFQERHRFAGAVDRFLAS